jgi:hypothetical protein
MHILLSSAQLPLVNKFLLKHVQPFIALKWLINLFENWWLCVKKVLEVAELVRFSPLMMVSTMSDVLRHSVQHLSHRSLTFSKHGQQLL